MGVGDNIKQLREAKGFSQRQLAQEAGISQSMLCQIERGTKNPSLPVGLALAGALEVRVERLILKKKIAPEVTRTERKCYGTK